MGSLATAVGAPVLSPVVWGSPFHFVDAILAIKATAEYLGRGGDLLLYVPVVAHNGT